MLTRRENLLIRPWQERRFIYHREKVQTASPAIDNNPPPKRPHVSYKLKKIQKEAERCSQIVSDNFTLLQHLSGIMSTTRVDHFWEEAPPNFLQRVGIYKIRSKEPKLIKSSDEPYERPATRKERCYGCSPERYQKVQIIPEERVPFPPPKQRVTRRAITPPDWESQYKFRCAEDRPEFRGKTWRKPVKKCKLDEEKRRHQRRRKRELSNGSQSIYLSKNGLTLAVKFPSRSEVLMSNRGGIRVIQREFCECKSFPKKLTRFVRSKKETITLGQLERKVEDDTLIRSSGGEQQEGEEDGQFHSIEELEKKNSLENREDEEYTITQQKQDELEESTENSEETSSGISQEEGVEKVENSKTDSETEKRKLDEPDTECNSDISDEERTLSGTKKDSTDNTEEESRKTEVDGGQDLSGNESVPEEVNDNGNTKKDSISTSEEKDNESLEVEDMAEEEKEQVSAEEISTVDISDPIIKETESQEDEENTDDLIAIAETELKDKASDKTSTENEAILRALTLDTSQELWTEDMTGLIVQDPLSEEEAILAKKQELVDQEIEKMFEEAENVISEVNKDDWLEELDPDIVESRIIRPETDS